MTSVVLFSGGIDSLVCLALEPGAHAFTVDYGQEARAELIAARYFAYDLGAAHHRATVRASWILDGLKASGVSSAYLPARNTMLIALAASLAERIGADRVVIGATAEDAEGFPDCRSGYIEAMNRTLAEGMAFPVTVAAPLVDMSKRQVVDLARELRLDLTRAVSCYSQRADGEPCGECESCRVRRAAGA